MLQARIGRFEAGPRRVVLAASVFGQTFRSGGVAALLDRDKNEPALGSWLDALCEAEVIQATPDSSTAQGKQYAFRHALVRDAAYGLLTEADQITGHRLAGAFLASAGEHDPAVVAAHQSLAQARATELGPDILEGELACRASWNLSLAFNGFLIGNDPFLPSEYARRGLAAFTQLGDLRHAIGPQSFLSMALLGLGEPDLAEQELRAAFKQAEHYGDLFLIDYVRLHLAFLLSGSASQSLEAAALAREQLNFGVANSLHTSMSHAVLSRVAAKNRVFRMPNKTVASRPS